MKPVICIPSYKRPNATAIQRLRSIPLDKYLFVRKEEEFSYKKIAEENGFRLVLLKNVTDLGTTRQKVVQYCYRKGLDWAFMFDDDISKVEMLGYNPKRTDGIASASSLGQKLVQDLSSKLSSIGT